jgi:septal ring factor EnvC (AmiA/AmiB activator)
MTNRQRRVPDACARRRPGRRLPAALLAATVLLFPWPAAILAQTGDPLRGMIAPEPPSDPAIDKRAQRQARQAELDAIERALLSNTDARSRLETELKELRGDSARLRAQLIAAVEKARDAEARLAAAEERFAASFAEEARISRSLAARREIIGEVLAVLQRLGRKPPPAVLVRADDMLAAIRSAMVLGSLLPELRAEAEALAGDLSRLAEVKAALDGERKTIGAALAALAGERTRIAALIELRQARLADSERQAAEEARRSRDLAGRARSLRDLIQNLESEIGVAADALARARKEAEALAERTRQRLAAAAVKDPKLLEPGKAFAQARGRLPLPADGSLLRAFGEVDGGGEKAQGASFVTASGAMIAAPVDARIAYAGPFRSFGKVLILNAGDGYYVVLAGMDRISVDAGQFVLAGEPVAQMGGISVSAPALTSSADGPVLYMELRKDGQTIDLSPWWPQASKEKVRG